MKSYIRDLVEVTLTFVAAIVILGLLAPWVLKLMAYYIDYIVWVIGEN